MLEDTGSGNSLVICVLPKSRVQSWVGELRSCSKCGMAKTNKQKPTKNPTDSQPLKQSCKTERELFREDCSHFPPPGMVVLERRCGKSREGHLSLFYILATRQKFCTALESLGITDCLKAGTVLLSFLQLLQVSLTVL